MNRTKEIALKAAGFFVEAIVAATVLPATAANLVAYYPLDSFWYSGGSSGVPYTTNAAPGSPWPGFATLQYSGGALYQGTISPGKFGNCYEETGSQAQISFGTMDPFALTGAFTFALWVYDPFTTTLQQQTMLLSKQNANTDHYFRIILRSGNVSTNADDMQIGAYYGPTGAGTFQDRNTGAFTNVVADPSERWVHIAVTAVNSGGTAIWQVYADGQLLPFAANTTLLDSSRTGIRMALGMTAGGQLQGYPGVKVDDIRFYDGVLTAAEIRAIPGVTPVSASIVVTSGVVTVSWNSFIGNRYQLQKTADPTSPSWTDVGSPVTATSTTTSASEAQGADPTCYRVQVLP